VPLAQTFPRVSELIDVDLMRSACAVAHDEIGFTVCIDGGGNHLSRGRSAEGLASFTGGAAAVFVDAAGGVGSEGDGDSGANCCPVAASELHGGDLIRLLRSALAATRNVADS
jgi:hypothetical protein